MRPPCVRAAAHRRAAGELFVAATALKRAETGSRPTATVLAVGVISLVDELLDHDLTAHLGKLTDAAHFGELLARADDVNRGGLTPAGASVLSSIGAQFSAADPLLEQLSRWSLEAGYYAARTGADPDEVLAPLRVDMARIVHGLALPPRPRAPLTIPTLPRPRVGAEDHVPIQ
jgi:hypothetical protein